MLAAEIALPRRIETRSNADLVIRMFCGVQILIYRDVLWNFDATSSTTAVVPLPQGEGKRSR